MDFEIEKGSRLRELLKEGRKKRRRRLSRLGFSAAILLSISLLIYFSFVSSKSTVPPADIPESTLPTPEETQPQDPLHQVIEGTIKVGSTFFQSLREKNVPPQWINLIISKLRPYVDFRKIKGGSFRLVTNGSGELVKFIYEASLTEVYEIEKESQGYVAQKKKVPLDTYLVRVEGEIRSSLFEAMDAAGEQDQLTISFAEILAWEIDFYKDVQEGDRFKAIVGKLYKGDQFIQYGTIHAIEYRNGDRTLRGIEFQGQYYHEDGTSLRKSFLKAPLRFSRISSRFSRARRHPILGGIFPHYGVDYAAPPGTPIWAVADGLVISCDWNEGYGKQLVLRHMNGYKTYYGHLSRYGHGIKQGVRVKQKQTIGYVGSTGLSTGPHLDYRLVKDGRFRNPLKESFPAGIPIGKEEIESFQKRRDEVVAWLQKDTAFKQKSSPLSVGESE
jgi:murein DD-endopeptidase MepM/ murein hydrolase activator NlpD